MVRRIGWDWALRLVMVALAVVAACSSDAPGTMRVDAPQLEPQAVPLDSDPGARLSKPFDIAEVMRRTHFAFRPKESGGGFEGGGDTYDVSVNQTGQVQVTAVAGGKRAAPVTVETAAIRRPGMPWGKSGAHVRVRKDGALELDRGPAVERWANLEKGAEVSWRFESKPEGSSELDIELSVSGQKYVGETDGGQHFRDDASGLGIRVGHAIWVEDNGKETAVRGTWDNGVVRYEVPGELAEGSQYPAVLDPTIGPEFGVDEPVSGPVGGSQLISGLASDGTGGPCGRTIARVPPASTLHASAPMELCLTPSGSRLARDPTQRAAQPWPLTARTTGSPTWRPA